jgi:hypothetical protein
MHAQGSRWGIALLATALLVPGCGKKDSDGGSEAKQPETPAEPVKPEPPPPPRADLVNDTTEPQGELVWATGLGALGREEPRAIALTPDGGAVITGIFADKVDFGKGELTAQALDIFVIKLDKDGAVEWSTGIGGGGEDIASGVAVDGKGNIVVVGWFSGEMMVGDTKLMASGADDIFVIKLDAKGAPAWARQFGGDHSDISWGVATDPGGDIVVVGEFRNTITFGGEPHESKGNADIFLLRLAEDGTFKWSKAFGDLGQDYGRAVAIDSRGDVVMAAEFSVEVDFGSGKPLVHKGNRDIVVAKYGADGTYRWAKAFGNTFDDIVLAAAVDPADNIVIGGSFEQKLKIGGTELESAGRKDALLAKLDPSGKVQWAKSYGAHRDDQIAALGADKFGNVLASGWFVDKVDFGGGGELKAPNGNQDAFLLKLDRDGGYLWSKRFGDKDHDRGRALAVTADGEITLAGLFRFEIDFGSKTLESAHKKKAKIAPADIFVARFTP